MDTYVRHMQTYINKGRSSMGLKKNYWSSQLHEIFKFSVKTAYDSKDSFDQLFSKLEMLHRRFRSTTTMTSRAFGIASHVPSSPPSGKKLCLNF